MDLVNPVLEPIFDVQGRRERRFTSVLYFKSGYLKLNFIICRQMSGPGFLCLTREKVRDKGKTTCLYRFGPCWYLGTQVLPSRRGYRIQGRTDTPRLG